MSKQSFVPVSSAELFSRPVCYERKPSRKTFLCFVSRDSSGDFVFSEECIEDTMSKIAQINFQELVLSNLVEKGVDPHGLDIIDTNRLGVDAGAYALYNELVSNSNLFVESSKD